MACPSSGRCLPAMTATSSSNGSTSGRPTCWNLSDNFHDLEHFYDHQKPTWDKLRKACDRFQLNRLELERDAKAAPALRRMQEILQAPSPYGIIKEAEGLIGTVEAVNTALVTERRERGPGEDRRAHRRGHQGT